MRRLLLAGILASMALQSQTVQQKRQALAVPMAEVRVVAYEANGRYLGAPEVSLFMEAAGHDNMASKFQNGVAVGIPYSVYRIEGRQAGYYSDVRYVRVYEPSVTVVLGLRFGAEWAPFSLPGRVRGLTVPPKNMFAKLIGVYENVSTESVIDGEGRFTLGNLSPGRFVLLIVGEGEVLANRTLTIPYDGQLLEIDLRTDLRKRSP